MIHLLRYSFMFVLMATLTLGLSAEDKLSSEVLGPDGKPVEKATLYRVRMQNPNHGQPWGVDQMDLAEWKSGKRFDDMDPHHFYEYLVIDSPGCALGIYQGGLNGFKLEKEFWVEGKVIDEKGKPVSDVELTLGKFGLYTYTNVVLNPMAGKLPWVQTKTDKDGKYRFRGAVLENYGFDSGVEVSARKMQDGKPMVGASALSFISDSPLFDEARKQKSHFEGGDTIQLLACDEVSGVVLDSVTGKPIAGATIHFGSLIYDLRGIDNDQFITGKDGTFSLKNVRVEMLGAEHPDYARGNLKPNKDWREKKHNKLVIKLAPLVETTIQFIDSHSGKTPLVPLEFSYQAKMPAGESWMLEISEADNCSMFFTKERQKLDSNCVFKGRLPVGTYQFECSMDRMRKENSPYAKEFELNIPYEGVRDFKVDLDRKPGLLFSLNPIDSSILQQNDKWDFLTGYMRVKESPYTHYVNLDKPIYFQPADQWNREMNFQVTLRKDSHETNLFERNFMASPDAWPVKIDAVAILGNLIGKDEK